MDRTQKASEVGFLDGVFAKNAFVIVGNDGLTVAQMTELRGELRQAGAKMKIVKNRLAKIALKGKPGEKVAGLFKGPTAIAYAEDPISQAKILEKYAKKNEKLVIRGGAMGAETFDAAGVKALASMPSREELLALIAATIGAPASNLVSAITAPAANIAGCIEAIEKKQAA
jgi:large subunit ribosomal protein L10